MIAVDTSAVVAVVLGEDEAESMLAQIQQNPSIMSAATLLEASIVVEARQGPDATRDLQLLVDAAIEITPFDLDHTRVAFEAWQRFGKGRHRAGLNLGDCFAYATASLAGVPLLFKGSDFTQTDIASVL
ncbi:MAG: type II toxin-antitoxin system VapC family toxin [Microthrixaceae bacterium]|nr:type II toxin-antitoxin system VapC family toxin [Microthrixaceae bacterium]MCO5314095.1 type II toxin-antitoxin system VapC family toxin [Microthrixaceae bacterium]